MKLLALSLLLFIIVTLSLVAATTSLSASNNGTITRQLAGRWFDYVLVIMMENHSINNTYDNGTHGCFGNCTYYTSLANSNGLAENYTNRGIAAGSIGDYIAITSGYGNTPQACNNGPSASGCSFLKIPNIIDRLENNHLSWKAYMEDYPIPFGCSNDFNGHYFPIHNPFIYYDDIQHNTTRCSKIVNANSQIADQVSPCWPSPLPNDDLLMNDLNSVAGASNYMFLTPNSVDDNHDCDDVSIGNAWLNKMIPQILGSTVFRTQRAALFITFDEPNCTFNSCPSPIEQLYTIWASNPANSITKTGFRSILPYTHFSPLRHIEDNWLLAPLIGSTDGSANNMQEFFL